MATEVELFEYSDIPTRPGIRGIIDTNGNPQILLGGNPTVSATTNPVTGGIEIPSGRQMVESTLQQGAYSDQAFPPDDYTLSATGVVAAQRGYLNAVELLSGTGVTLTIRDCPDTAFGRQVWAMPATSGPRRFEFAKPLPYHTGMHATIGGSSPSIRFYVGAAE